MNVARVAGTDASSIEFRVLGPVEVVRDGTALALGGTRQRSLLALLLLEPGRSVPADRLVENLWRGDPPAAAPTTLRSYVSRLRTVLGPQAPISGDSAGYALDVPPERVDSFRFEHWIREGQSALARRASKRAREQLRRALDLWRGRPFGELGDDGPLRSEADRLEELRLLALEQRIEADLELALSAELVDELERLVAEHPERETLWRQLMLALYRAGRQADALGAYRRARTFLHEQLGLEPGDDLKELEQAILRQEVEPVQPPEERHNLPSQVTSFVGRGSELNELEQLLRGSRLVTLTGVGGVGKTRLALETGKRLLPDFPDGVFVCDLAPLAEAELVPRDVARVLGVAEQTGATITERLVGALRDSDLLLLLDNCEHLRQPCADLSHTLLTRCPDLRILATSREALGLSGEVDYDVPPLTLPPAEASADELRSSDAILLFLARAHSARPRLPDDAAAVTTAARICVDLDGLPLAIELAAARAKALSLEDIAARLSDRFRFLVSWRRLTPARHRTLAEAMDWSYELLSEPERRLLARLSVFAGGFTLSAVSAVCLDGDEERALELVERLVESSLVLTEERRGQMRYRMLETVRQYAAERLRRQGETVGTRRRHAEYFAANLDELLELQWANLDQWVERLAADEDNLRTALAWGRAEDPELLLRLTGQLWQFWWVRGRFSEGRGWLDAALDRGRRLGPELRGRVLEGAAGLAWAQGDIVQADALAEEARPLFAAMGDRRGESASLILLGHVALEREEFALAESHFERSRELGEEMGADTLVAVSLHNLASVAFAEGDLERAASRYRSALSRYQAQGDQYGIALSELFLGAVAIEAGRHAEAAEYLGRALPVFREMEFLQYATQCVEAIALLVEMRRETRAAVQLLGGAASIRERIGQPPRAPQLPRAEILERAAAELGQSDFAAAWAEGLALSEDTVLEQAQRAVAR